MFVLAQDDITIDINSLILLLLDYINIMCEILLPTKMGFIRCVNDDGDMINRLLSPIHHLREFALHSRICGRYMIWENIKLAPNR